MRATGSTPTAMRWRSSEWRGGLLLLAHLVLGGLATACTPRVTTFYTPSEGESRVSTDELRAEGDRVLAIECPRLLGAGQSATAEAAIVVDVDRASGAVSRARVERGTGDARIDDIFGALAARLQFDPPSEAKQPTVSGRIGVGYSCSPQAAVTTLRLPGESGWP